MLCAPWPVPPPGRAKANRPKARASTHGAPQDLNPHPGGSHNQSPDSSATPFSQTGAELLWGLAGGSENGGEEAPQGADAAITARAACKAPLRSPTSSRARRNSARAFARLMHTAAPSRISCRMSHAWRPDAAEVADAMWRKTAIASGAHAPVVSATIGTKVTPTAWHRSSVPWCSRFQSE